jgi:hypothetical protein
MNNEQIIRRAYGVAEKVDLKGSVDCFTPDGTFTDMVATQAARDGSARPKTINDFLPRAAGSAQETSSTWVAQTVQAFMTSTNASFAERSLNREDSA